MASPLGDLLSDTEKANMLTRRVPYDKRLKNLETIEQQENAGKNTGADDPVELDKWQDLKRKRRLQKDMPSLRHLREKGIY